MATITKRKRKNGDTYCVQVRITGHKPRSSTHDTRSAAMRWAEDTETALRTGGVPPGEELPLDDRTMTMAIDEYLTLTEADPTRSKNTIRLDRDTGKRLITGLGRLSLRSVTQEDIEEYKMDRLQVVGPSSVRQDLSMLFRIYETARIRWRLKDLSFPGVDVKLPAPPPNRKVILTGEQIPALLEECRRSKNPLLHALVLLLIETGMRPDKAVMLRWQRVYLDAGVIDLTKTKTEPRRVPISDGCVERLREMKGSSAESQLLFLTEEMAAKDRPLRHYRRSFAQACIRARINRPTKRDVSKAAAAAMEDIRNRAASRCIHSAIQLRPILLYTALICARWRTPWGILTCQ